jgi:hypothetical protein
MTTYGGGELNAPDYDGGSMLLMPTLRHDEWANLDLPAARALIAALHVAGSINAKRRIPFLAQASAAILAHIQESKGDIADSFASATPAAAPSARTQALTRMLDFFPRQLRGLPNRQGAATEKSIWELYGYDQDIFDEMKTSAEGVRPTYAGLPDLEFNVRVAKTLFQQFKNVEFKDCSDQETPHLSDGKGIVDFGCDLKLLMIWLSVVGPVQCEIGAGPSFAKLEGDRARRPSPADHDSIVVPTPPAKDLEEEYVTVVAWRPGPELKERLLSSKTSLREEIMRVDRERGPLDVQYLLRRTDEEGKTIETWGDGGYAWMGHTDFRRVIRWFRAKVPDSFLEKSAA